MIIDDYFTLNNLRKKMSFDKNKCTRDMKMRITSATQDKKWLKIKKKVSPTMKEEEDATGYTM